MYLEPIGFDETLPTSCPQMWPAFGKAGLLLKTNLPRTLVCFCAIASIPVGSHSIPLESYRQPKKCPVVLEFGRAFGRFGQGRIAHDAPMQLVAVLLAGFRGFETSGQESYLLAPSFPAPKQDDILATTG